LWYSNSDATRAERMTGEPVEKKRYIWAFVAAFLLTLPLVNPATRGDGFFYLAHLRSALLDGDLTLDDELPFANEKVREKAARELAAGRPLANKFPIGAAAMWAPYYVPVHAVSGALARRGYAVRADGFAGQYLWAVALATALYVFAGLLLIYELLTSYFREPVALAAVLALWLATSLPAYAYFHPTMAHGVSFFAVALFIFIWHQTRGRRRYIPAVALGAVAALMTMARTQNAFFLLIPVAEYVGAIWRADQRRGGPARRQALGQLAAMLLAAAVAFTPQLAAWRIINGSFFRTGYEAEYAFSWTRPEVGRVLFSTFHGAFLWTPVLALAVAGLALFWRRDRFLAAAAAACFAAQVYFVAAWWCWWQGSSFGGRMLIGTYPLLAFGLAAAFAALTKRLPTWTAFVVVALLAAWNANVLFQFGAGLIPREGPASPKLVWENTAEVPAKVWRFGRRYLSDRERARRDFRETR